jgi:hypothetical protein
MDSDKKNLNIQQKMTMLFMLSLEHNCNPEIYDGNFNLLGIVYRKRKIERVHNNRFFELKRECLSDWNNSQKNK